MISRKLHGIQYEQCPLYIIQSFDAFVWNKHHIILDLALTKKHFPKLCSLFLQQKVHDLDDDILNLKIMELFENLKDVEIRTSNDCQIDLLSFSASLIQSRLFRKNDVRIFIKAKQGVNKSWIINAHKSLIQTECIKYFKIRISEEKYQGKDDSKYEEESADVIKIAPINDAWKCPVCYYGHPKMVLKCTFCGFSTEETEGYEVEGVELYKQILVMYDHDKYFDEEDEFLEGKMMMDEEDDDETDEYHDDMDNVNEKTGLLDTTHGTVHYQGERQNQPFFARQINHFINVRASPNVEGI